MASPNWDSMNVQLASLIADPVASATSNGQQFIASQRDDALNSAIKDILYEIVQMESSAKRSDMLLPFRNITTTSILSSATTNDTSLPNGFVLATKAIMDNQEIGLIHGMFVNDFIETIRGWAQCYVYNNASNQLVAHTQGTAGTAHSFTIEFVVWMPMTNGFTTDIPAVLYNNYRQKILELAHQHLMEIQAKTI